MYRAVNGSWIGRSCEENNSGENKRITSELGRINLLSLTLDTTSCRVERQQGNGCTGYAGYWKALPNCRTVIHAVSGRLYHDNKALQGAEQSSLVQSAGCIKAKLFAVTREGDGREQLRTVMELVTCHCDLRKFQHKEGNTDFLFCDRCEEFRTETPTRLPMRVSNIWDNPMESVRRGHYPTCMYQGSQDLFNDILN